MNFDLNLPYHYDYNYAYYSFGCRTGFPDVRLAGKTLRQKKRTRTRQRMLRRLGRLCAVQSSPVMDAVRTFSGISSIFDACKNVYFQKLLEDILMMVYGLSTANNMMDVMFTLINFVKLRIEGPVTRVMMEKFIFPFFEEHCMDTQSGLEDKIYGNVQALRNLTENYEEVWEVPVVKKFYRFTMFCIANSLFDRVGLTMDNLLYNKMEQEALRRQYNKRSDFMMCVLDTATFIVERGMQCKMTGSLDPILHTSSHYQEWFDKCTNIIIKSKHLGNAEAFETTYHQFVADLEDCIEKGEAIVKAAYKVVGDIRFIKMKLVELKTIKADLVSKRAAGQMREAPLSFLIFGPSSIAKSTLQEVLFQAYGKLKGMPTASEFKYTVNYFDEFTSNFNTSKWCVCIDDAAWQNASIKTVDPSLVSIINIVNNMPLITNQAALEDKGKIPMRPKLVLCSTNTMDLNASAYFSCPLAVQRRFPFIICPTVKTEFQGTNADGLKVNILDQSLAAKANVPGQWPDFWNIEIKRVVPAMNNSTQGVIVDLPNPLSGEPHTKFTNINDFLLWYKSVIEKFSLVQSTVVNSMKSLEEMEMCTVTMTNKLTCSHCMSLQSGLLTLEEVPDATQPREYAPDSESEEESLSSSNGVVDTIPKRFYAPPRAPILQSQNEGMLNGYSDFIEEWLKVQEKRETTTGVAASLEKRIFIWGFRLYLHYSFIRTSVSWIATIPMIRNLFWAVAKNQLLGVEEGRIAIALLGKRLYTFVNQPKYRQIRVALKIATAMWIGSRGALMIANYMRNRREAKFDEGKDLRTATEWDAEEALNQNSVRNFRNSTRSGGINELPDTYQNQLEVDEDVDIQHKADILNQHLQGAIYSKDNFVKDFQENVWKREEYQTTTFDVPPAVLASARTLDEFTQMLYNNLYFSKCKVREGLYRPGRVVNICGHVYMTNNHNIPAEGEIELQLCRETPVTGVTSNVKLILQQSDIVRDLENDLCYFQVFNNPPGRDIRKYIAKSSFGGVAGGVLLGRGKGGNIERRNVHNIHNSEMFVAELGKNMNLWGMYLDGNTSNGDCGSLLVMKSPVGNVIVGMHILGGMHNMAYSLKLNDEMINRSIARFGGMHIQSGMPSMSTPSVERRLTPELHKNSTLRWMAEGSARVYGSFTDFRARMNSKVCESYLGPKIRELRGWSVGFGRPQMKSWMPWHLAMKDIFAAKTNYKRKFLNQAKDGFLQDILSKLGRKDLDELQVVSDRAAVNGIAGVKFIDKMNFNTSLGFPWKKCKKFEMHDDTPTSDQPDAKTFTQEIWDRVRDCESKYKQGVRYMPVFTAHLKDEPLALAKVEAGKVRVFAGGPTDWSIVVRKYLISFIRVMMNNRFIFEAAPGTVAQSLEWEEIRNHLTKFGEKNIVAGDYGKFDKKMLPDFILAAYDIIIEIHRFAGWSEEDLLVLKCIAEDTAYPLIDFDGDLIEFLGSNPSGHPLTVIINSIVNSLYQRYAYIELNPEKHCRDFQDNVALMTYGDDNAFGVSSSKPWFNHTAIQGVLDGIGVTYTMADKEAESVPFIDICDVSFLKRTWRWDTDLEAYLCPLEEMSLVKMLTIWLPSKTICPEAQMIAVIESAVNEWFFYGKKRFNKEREFLMSLINDDLRPYVGPATFPTWDDLAKRFKDNSKHVPIYAGKPWASTREEAGLL